jgi:hypothetical protein
MTTVNENIIENKFKVKLVPSASSGLSQTKNRVVFDVTPDLIETRNVNYKSIDPVHAPGQIFVYGGSSSRLFNISNARFISRTVEEADLNLKRLWLLRSWTVSHFGSSSTLNNSQIDFRTRRALDMLTESENLLSSAERSKRAGSELLGRPPEVLLLSAYSKSGGGYNGSTTSTKVAEHINRVPVVLQQISFPYPSDVDYINTSKGVPMTIIMIIDMTLMETHSAREYEQFSIQDFRAGRLIGF